MKRIESADSRAIIDNTNKNRLSWVGDDNPIKYTEKYFFSLPISVFSLYNTTLQL